MKWYEEKCINKNIIISSRVRLARNLKGYPFYKFLNKENAIEIVNKTKATIFNSFSNSENFFKFIYLKEKNDVEKMSMVENHLISLDLIKNDLPKGVILQKDEKLTIMINEEDHIRIQSIENGDNIEKAFEKANKIDDLLAENLAFAYDKDFGYLTSCLTNIGTGIRVSFMLHLPMLENHNKINEIAQSISKFGMTIRGIYGEGTKPLASIYQISNQATLGKTEKQILIDIKNIAMQIAEKEKYLRRNIQKNNIELIDKIYRSYGALKYCKKISNKEALNHLSNLWLGIYADIFEKHLLKFNIYNIMMMIQPANLMQKYNNLENKQQFEIYRAKLINKMLQ